MPGMLAASDRVDCRAFLEVELWKAAYSGREGGEADFLAAKLARQLAAPVLSRHFFVTLTYRARPLSPPAALYFGVGSAVCNFVNYLTQPRHGFEEVRSVVKRVRVSFALCFRERCQQ